MRPFNTTTSGKGYPQPRDIEVRSKDGSLTFFLDGSQVWLKSHGLQPVAVPAELRSSTMHGFAVDTHFVKPFAAAETMPAILEVRMAALGSIASSSSSPPTILPCAGQSTLQPARSRRKSFVYRRGASAERPEPIRMVPSGWQGRRRGA